MIIDINKFKCNECLDVGYFLIKDEKENEFVARCKCCTHKGRPFINYWFESYNSLGFKKEKFFVDWFKKNGLFLENPNLADQKDIDSIVYKWLKFLDKSNEHWQKLENT